jgi:hypothetical protein
MKPLSDLPYIEWTEANGAVSRLYADVIEAEGLELPAVVTEHAVEKGANVTDHYRKQLEEGTFTMFFSGSPIRGDLDPDNPGKLSSEKLPIKPAKRPSLFGVSNLVNAGVGALGDAIGLGGPSEPTHMTVLKFERQPKRLDAALELVRRLQTEGLLINIKFSFGRAENMGITKAGFSRKPEDGDGGSVVIDAKQMKFVESDIALATPLPAEPRGLPKKTASADGAAAQGEGDKTTALRALVKSFGGS